MNRQYILIGGVSVVSLAVGVAAGYKYAVKTLDTRYNELMEAEIQRTEEHYSKVYKKGKFASPVDAVSELLEQVEDLEPESQVLLSEAAHALVNYQGRTPAKATVVTTVTEEVTLSDPINKSLAIFDGDNEFAGMDDPTSRNPLVPYIVREEEFLAGELDHEQVSLTYYTEDDILADSSDKVEDDVDETVGIENLTRFGVGARHHNTVHVRNERLGLDYEIVKHTGSYARDVLGLPDDDGRIRNPKFRPGDDG